MDYSTVTSLVGETLIILQKLEALLKASLILASDAAIADQKLRQLLERDKETLGMLLRHMKSRVELPEDFESELECLLCKRNIFIHKMFMEDWFDLKSEAGLRQVKQFTDEILKHAKIAIQIFVGYAQASIKGKVVSLPAEQGRVFDHIITRIYLTANPDFGDKTPVQYVEAFSKKLKHEVAPKIKK